MQACKKRPKVLHVCRKLEIFHNLVPPVFHLASPLQKLLLGLLVLLLLPEASNPVKMLYVGSRKPMRKLNVEHAVRDISMVEENITESLHCLNSDNAHVCVCARTRAYVYIKTKKIYELGKQGHVTLCVTNRVKKGSG